MVFSLYDMFVWFRLIIENTVGSSSLKTCESLLPQKKLWRQP